MLLPLDTFRQKLGLHPWHFWGLADNTLMPINAKCSGLVLQYAWQGSDAAGRDDVREAITRAEEKLREYLGYPVAPQYIETASLPWPRLGNVGWVRYGDTDATGRRVAMPAPDGYVLALGVEQLSLIGTATSPGTLVYSDRFGTGFADTFTITLPTSATDPDQIAVYFAAADRFDDTALGDRWRIAPVEVAISGGNVVITGRRYLLVRPILYERPSLSAIDPTSATNFATSLEIYQRTTNGDGNTVSTSQATLVYESNDCGGWGAGYCCSGATTTTTDPGTVGEVIARAGIRSSELGLVTPAAAVYNTDTATWSQVGCCYAEPDRVKLRYLAGYPLQNGRMDETFSQAVVCLAAAELKTRVAACQDVNARLFELQRDLALESTETERYRPDPADLRNPFGTRRGHVQAWRLVQDRILRRGIMP